MSQERLYTAEMVCDSVSPSGVRLSTIQVHMPRMILAEANTHRVFSRNARSTRAVPTTRLISEVRDDPYVPLKWLKNKPGMQASEPMTGDMRDAAEATWRASAAIAANISEGLFEAGLHKQWAGRPLEPYMWVDWLVSSTDWHNFLELRDHGDAQPEIELVAKRVRACLDKSMPRQLRPGEWHLPYVTDNDWETKDVYDESMDLSLPGKPVHELTIIKISVARCARVSYAPFDGEGDVASELARYERLASSRPLHASSMEHQATPDRWVDKHEGPHGEWRVGKWAQPELHGNFRGWVQNRKVIEAELARATVV